MLDSNAFGEPSAPPAEKGTRPPVRPGRSALCPGIFPSRSPPPNSNAGKPCVSSNTPATNPRRRIQINEWNRGRVDELPSVRLETIKSICSRGGQTKPNGGAEIERRKQTDANEHQTCSGIKLLCSPLPGSRCLRLRRVPLVSHEFSLILQDWSEDPNKKTSKTNPSLACQTPPQTPPPGSPPSRRLPLPYLSLPPSWK